MVRRLHGWAMCTVAIVTIGGLLAPSAGAAARTGAVMQAAGFWSGAVQNPSAAAPRQATAVAVPHVAGTSLPGITLPLTSLDQMVVDSPDELVFVTGTGTVSGQDLVVYSMTTHSVVRTLSEPGAQGMALNGSILYVYRCAAGTIDAIDTHTDQVAATIAVPPVTTLGFGCNLAVAGGRLWFSDDAAGLAAVPLTAPFTVQTYSAPDGDAVSFATTPSHPDELVAFTADAGCFEQFDVSGATPVLGASNGSAATQVGTLSPDGASIVAVQEPPQVMVRYLLASPSTPALTYQTPDATVQAAAVDPSGGYVATVTDQEGSPPTVGDVYVFPIGSATPSRHWRLNEAGDGVFPAAAGFSGDSQTLYVATEVHLPGTLTTKVVLHALTYPDALPDTLTVSASSGSIRYGGSIIVTAHLAHFATNRLVSIYGTTFNSGHYYLLGHGEVGPLHNFSVVAKPGVDTTYVASYGGDAGWQPVKSTGFNVFVHIIVTGKLSGYYATSSGYHLYHQGTDPVYSAQLDPPLGGVCASFVLERHYSTGWRYTSKCFTTSSRGAVSVRILGLTVGAEYRIGAAYEDSQHAVGGTPWSYFKVT